MSQPYDEAMVERAARELFWADDSDLDSTWDTIGDEDREPFRLAARALLDVVAWDIARAAWNAGYTAAVDQIWGPPP